MTLLEITKAAIILPFLIFLTIAGCAKNRDHHRARPRKPPVEAVQACAGRSVGSSVSFTGRNGEMVPARCQEVAGELLAVPDGFPRDAEHTD